MKEFAKLRDQAKEKRDRIIASAKAEYVDTLSFLSAVERQFLGRSVAFPLRLDEAIQSAIPIDRPFTMVDIMAELRARDPKRTWLYRSVCKQVWKLLRGGAIRLVKESRGGYPAVYILTGVDTNPVPFEGMTLPEVIANILGQHAMRPVEIVVTMLERGFPTNQSRNELRRSVESLLRKDRRFKDEGGKWAKQ